MATVNKDFRIKSGLIVEGANATVNGEDIITTGSSTDDLQEGSTNVYFTDGRAKDSAASLLTNATLNNITITGTGNGGLTITAENGVGDSTTDDLDEGIGNLYFTDQRALNAVSGNLGTGIVYSAETAGNVFHIDENYLNTEITDGARSAISVEQGGSPLTYDSGTGVLGIGIGASGGIGLDVSNDLEINRTVVDGWYDASGSASTAETNANNYTNTALLDYTTTANLDTTIDGYGYLKSADLSGYATESYVGTAIDNLVDGAPGLLDTLNEIAAAINDDANYATTMTTALAGKQDELTAGSGISINSSTDTISINYNTGLELDGFGKLVVDTDVIASKTYVDTNFVNVDDLPGQLDDYVPLTQKGANDGVATLDSTGQVPLSQLGNVPAAYITSVGTNLDVTSQNLTISDTPTFTSVDVTWVRKEEATWTNAATAGTFTAHTFATSEGSVKYLVRIFNNGASQVSEVLVTTDSSNNIAVLEYGTIYTSENELATITADWDSGNSQYRLRVTTANNSSEILVAATLLAYND